MIKLKNFDDQSIGEILEDAKSKINCFNSEWTYHGESDPGITLLELLIWFIKIQREYISSVSPALEVKILNILGIKLRKNRGSKTLVKMTNINSNNCCINIPKGTKFLADEMIFENNEEKYLINSQILSIKFNNPEFNLEEEYYNFDGYKNFFIFGKNINSDNNEIREFYINFDKKLPQNKKISIYFEIFSEKKIKRNAINNFPFKPLAEIKWEYYGLKNSNLDWHTLQVQDSTYNFLFSGIVELKIDGQMKPFTNLEYYSLRVVFLKSDHNFSPQITKILTNVFEIEQKDTQCEKIVFKKYQLLKIDKKFKYLKKEISISSHLSLYGSIMIYLKNDNGKWCQEENFKIFRNISKGTVKIILEDIKFINKFELEDEVIMIISYSDYIRSKIIIGDGNGFSSQTFNVSYKNDPIIETFELLIGEEKDNKSEFEIWNQTDDFFSCNKNDKKFLFEKNISSIIFGNNINGKIPKRCKNGIRICNIAFTSGELSNIKSGMINSLISENSVLKMFKINQLTEAKGGRDNENLFDAKKRALDLFSDKKNIVTIKDFEKVIRETPGLIIKNLKIIPKGIKENCSRTIDVVVLCDGVSYLPQSYKRNIALQIEKYRLLGMVVNIIEPEYIYVKISIKVYTNSNFKVSNKILENKIKNFFEDINLKIGQILNYVDIYNQIEKVDFVNFVKYLNINVDHKHIKLLNKANSIIAPENGIYILENLNIDYLVSPKI